jgi:peptidoglycan/LPS O-acetylase OafA/YrhL
MGACAYWAGTSARRGEWLALLALLGLGVGLTLVFEFRERIAVALAVTLWLGGLMGQPALLAASKEALPLLGERIIQWGGRTSYALFLVHFAVLTLVNTLYANLAQPSWGAVAACVVLYWLASMGLAAAFERWVERPLQTPPWVKQA